MAFRDNSDINNKINQVRNIGGGAPSGFDNRKDIGTNVSENLASNFAGILSTRPTAKYASGARCLLKINGVLCGFAFGVSWNIQTSVTEIRTIDDYLPNEFVPQSISVDGTISALHIPGQGVGAKLWQPDILNFLFQQYITIEVRDSNTDSLLFFTDKAVITSRREDINVDQLARVSLSWRAIGFRDEREPKLPSDFAPPDKTSVVKGVDFETQKNLDATANTHYSPNPVRDAETLSNDGLSGFSTSINGSSTA